MVNAHTVLTALLRTVLSVETLGNIFMNTACEASCNYGIGYDGRVLLCVDESNRSWCSSSNANDQRAVTIECASDTVAPYTMNSKVYNKLIALCVDICKRNGKTKLLWFGNEDKTLNYSPKSGEMVLTVHRWFANKSCPGDWLYNRLGNLADEVTAQLGGKTSNKENEEMIKYGAHNTATLAFKKQLITLYNMRIIKTKVDNSNGFGDGTLKAVKRHREQVKSQLTVSLARRPSMLSIISSMTVFEQKTTKLPTQKGTRLIKT